MSGLSIASSADSKNCWFVLNNNNPVLVSMPSNKAEGNPVLHDISIGSIALTVNAVSANRLPKSPGLDVNTFVPANIYYLFRKNSILLIVLPFILGMGFGTSSPTCLSVHSNLSTVKVATSLDVPALANEVL